MARARIVALLAAALICLGVYLGSRESLEKGEAPTRGPRIVSLSPAITDTLCALGAGGDLVGRSDFCDFPAAVGRLPKTGTSIHPDFEAIARLRPTIVLGEASTAAHEQGLDRLAMTELLPWLEVVDIAQSVRSLGRLVRREEAAESLALQFERLAASDSKGPRVLMVLAHQGELSECYFIRRNSLHGALLRAAGGRNAVDRDVAGVPTMSLEGVCRLDPEVVVILNGALSVDAQESRRLSADWGRLGTLSAVRSGRVYVVSDPAAFSTGPRALGLLDPLRRILRSEAEH